MNDEIFYKKLSKACELNNKSHYIISKLVEEGGEK